MLYLLERNKWRSVANTKSTKMIWIVFQVLTCKHAYIHAFLPILPLINTPSYQHSHLHISLLLLLIIFIMCHQAKTVLVVRRKDPPSREGRALLVVDLSLPTTKVIHPCLIMSNNKGNIPSHTSPPIYEPLH